MRFNQTPIFFSLLCLWFFFFLCFRKKKTSLSYSVSDSFMFCFLKHDLLLLPPLFLIVLPPFHLKIFFILCFSLSDIQSSSVSERENTHSSYSVSDSLCSVSSTHSVPETHIQALLFFLHYRSHSSYCFSDTLSSFSGTLFFFCHWFLIHGPLIVVAEPWWWHHRLCFITSPTSIWSSQIKRTEATGTHTYVNLDNYTVIRPVNHKLINLRVT